MKNEFPAGSMKKHLFPIVLAIFLLIIGGGAAFLATWDIPPPASKVERVLPDEQFPR